MAERSAEYYRRLVDTAVLAGEIMISSGAETHRVEDTIARILKTTGFPQAEAFVLPTGITVTLSDQAGETLSVTKRVVAGPTVLSRVYLVNNVSRDFCGGKTELDDAYKRLISIKKSQQYTVLQRILGTMTATGAFTILFGGSFYDCIAAAIAGFLLGIGSYYLRKIIRYGFIVDALGAALITVTAIMLMFIGREYLGIPLQSQYIIVGSMMPLVPGVAITNAIRDTFQGDYISSCARAVDAFMTAAAVAVGVGAGMALCIDFGVLASEFDVVYGSIGTSGFALITAAISAAISTFGFCLIFDVPIRFSLPACFTSAVVWTSYLMMSGFFGASEVWASFIGAAIADLASQIFAKRMKAPVTLFLIAAILPLVPGVHIYRSVFYLINGGGSSSDALTRTLTIAGAIALGLIAVDTVFDMSKRIGEKARKRKLLKLTKRPKYK